MKEEIHQKDEAFKGIAGAIPRKVIKGTTPNWKQKLLGGLTKDEDGKYRPAPEKEKEIQEFAHKYAALRGLRRIRVPDVLLRAIFARGGLLDRLVESSHPKLVQGFRYEAMNLRKGVKLELGGLPDDIFLDPKRLPDGTHRALVMELKTKAGKVSRAQRDVAQTVGGFHVPRSKDEVKTLLDEFVSKAGKAKE